MAGGGLLSGAVKSYNALKGFGFISSDAVEGDVFFMRTTLPADAAQLQGKQLEGRSVDFSAEQQADGRLKATGVRILSSSAMGLPFNENETLPGTVKAFSDKNGYGFIESSAVDGDVRFDRQAIQFQQPGANLVGQLVIFTYQALPDGKLRAKSVEFQSGPVDVLVPGGSFGKSFGKADPWAQGGGKSFGKSFGKADPWAQGGGKSFGKGKSCGNGASFGKGSKGWGSTGTVKSFSDKNGYGFITVNGQPDIKFGRADIVGAVAPAAGTMVSFTMCSDNMGRLSAKEVQPAGGGTKRPASAMVPMMSGGPQKFKNMGGKGGNVPTNSTGQWLTGTIKSFNELKGFGFIENAGLSGDVFFMKSDVPQSFGMPTPIQQGACVTFELVETGDGKFRAQGLAF